MIDANSHHPACPCIPCINARIPAPHPLPAGATFHPGQSTRSTLPDADLDRMCRTHATQVALMRHYDAQPSDAPLASYHARWAGDAMREARRIRTELRAHGCGSVADRLAADAYGVVEREGM